jgi:O-antigen/teichoic acid export membrane protein
LKNLRKNIFSNILLTGSQVIFPLLTFPYITRVLSNESLGSVVYVDAFTQYFIIISSLGIPLYGVREIAKVSSDKMLRSKLVIELLIIKLILSVLLSVVLISLYFFTSTFDTNFGLIKLACLGIISSSFFIEWFYQGIQDFSFITKRSLIIRILSVFAIFFFVHHYDDNVIYYAILILVSVANSLVNFGYYLNSHHQRFNLNLEFKKHFKPLAVLFSINIAVSIYTVLDTIILGILTNYTDVSYYNVGFRISKIFSTIIISIGFVLIPRISKIYADQDFNSLKALISKSMSIVFILAIPFFFFNLVYAEEFIVLIAGKNYANAANAIRIFSINPLIIGICNVMGAQFLLPIGKEKKVLYATVFGLLISLTLNFSLIPYFGFIGASIACVSAESVVMIYIYFSAKKEIKLELDLNLLILILSTSILTGSFIYLFNDGNLFIAKLIIVILFYSVTFVLLNLFFFKNKFVTSVLKLNNE